jgi:P-loop Domain of unknown function (DUF2791)
MTMAMHSASSTLSARRAIEALRSGVPSRDAVRRIGSSQDAVCARFEVLLRAIEDSAGAGATPEGVLVGGDFGSGKSHLLHHLESLAQDQGFVTSRIVISKETPLYDPAKIFNAAMSDMRVPGGVGDAMSQIAPGLAKTSSQSQELLRWTDPARSGLPAQFAATLYVFQNGGDPEFSDRIIRFWSGDKLSKAELVTKLRLLGEASTYQLQALPPAPELALHRFRFVSRLAQAAGYRGWVLLLDEVELIGQYSFRQRARSYVELARFMGKLDAAAGGSLPGVGAVLAISADFEAAVLGEKNDAEMVPGKLRASVKDADHLLATRAERGMRTIRSSLMRLVPPTADGVQSTYQRISEIYDEAFGWRPPALVTAPRIESSSRMRQFVRRWITEWDLSRLYPNQAPNVVFQPLPAASYADDPDLEPSDVADDV